MYSVLAWRAPSKAPLIERKQVGPIAVQWMWVNRGNHTPGWMLRRRVDKAAQALTSHVITQGVFPDDMAPVGIHPVDSMALRQHLSVALLADHLAQRAIVPAQATVGLVGGTMTPILAKTLEHLALHHRHVLLHATGAEALCQQLRSRYGVAVQSNPGLSSLKRCDGIIAFAPLPGLHPHVITYDQDAPLPPLHWPAQWTLPHPITPLQGWAMVAGSTIWQENWTKLAFLHSEL